MLDGTYPTRKFATLGLGNQPLFYLWGLARAKPSGRKVSTKINLDLSNIKSFFKYRI